MSKLHSADNVHTLCADNDPAGAHKLLDEMLATCSGPTSVAVLVYEAGYVPRMAYSGRVLSHTELRGVLTTALLGVGNDG